MTETLTIPTVRISRHEIEAIARVALARETDNDNRYQLAGVHFGFHRGALEVCATDGKIMAIARLDAHAEVDEFPNVILSAEAVAAISSMVQFSRRGGECTAELIEKRYQDALVTPTSCQVGDTEYQHIDGLFPDYRSSIDPKGAELFRFTGQLNPEYLMLAQRILCGVIAPLPTAFIARDESHVALRVENGVLVAIMPMVLQSFSEHSVDHVLEVLS